jgi:ABC-type proline/glycine betaine transport system permease subunit
MRIDWHKTVDFIRKDWHSHPVRLMLETFNWILNIIIATSVSLTVPYTNWLYVYPVIFVAISISIYSSISRGSFGILLTSITLLVIDAIGYYRVLVLS